jgi:hypothetical protein
MPNIPERSRLGQHGGRRAKGVGDPDRPFRGGRREYVLARLERDGRHDLAAAIRAGRVSAYTVAIELGWIARPARIGTGSDNAQKRRQLQLRALIRAGLFNAPHVGGGDQHLDPGEALELIVGPNSNMGSLFRTRDELRAAWERGRDELMARASPGKRPQAWWQFDAGELRHPGSERERSCLWRAGRLSAAEKVELEQLWFAEWTRCSSPKFAISLPWPNEPISGEAARRRHLELHDVPTELSKIWESEADKKAPPG